MGIPNIVSAARSRGSEKANGNMNRNAELVLDPKFFQIHMEINSMQQRQKI